VTRPGHRLPHAWLERDGQRLSTQDLAGPSGSFVLITGPDAGLWSDAARGATEKFGVAITVATIGSGGEYADPEGTWARVRQIDADGAILVRPDTYVAWRAMRASDAAAESFLEAVQAILVP
jgi:2,4-dichlorophenol 6-monooxygenase